MPFLSLFCDMSTMRGAKVIIWIKTDKYDYFPGANKAMRHGDSQWFSDALNYLFRITVPKEEKFRIPSIFRN